MAFCLIESARRFVRSCIGTGRLYTFGARFLNWGAICRKEGFSTLVKFWEIGRSAPGRKIELSLRSLKHSFTIRSGSEDFSTLVTNVFREEYGQFDPISPKWMIDAGAFIGDTGAYFLTRFPELRVIALEPNPKNYEMAKLNLKPYGDRAKLLKEGLFSTDGTQRFCGESTTAGISDSGFEIQTVSIPTLMVESAIDHIDILKLDIEGAEDALFRSDASAWLPKVSWIVIEIHGAKILDVVAHSLVKAGFKMRRFRSVWYCHK